MQAADYESRESSYFESMREHIFISELLQEAWVSRRQRIEVLRSEVDSSGYDLVLDCHGSIRHVQLKSSKADARRAQQTVNTRLSEKPSGCVVWLLAQEDPESGRVKLGYLFFGGDPGRPLPSLHSFKVGRHTKGDASGHKAERPGTRVIPKSRFTRIASIGLLLDALFGPMPRKA